MIRKINPRCLLQLIQKVYYVLLLKSSSKMKDDV